MQLLQTGHSFSARHFQAPKVKSANRMTFPFGFANGLFQQPSKMVLIVSDKKSYFRAFTLGDVANIALSPGCRMRELIYLQLVAADSFKLVEWEKTGSGKPFDPSGMIGLSGMRRRGFKGATVVGYRIITKFQRACVGLQPRVSFAALSHLDGLLIASVPLPATAGNKFQMNESTCTIPGLMNLVQ